VPVFSLDRAALGESEVEYLDNLHTYVQSNSAQ
jgi:hypothetical protein